MIRILIVDDHAVVRKGIKQILEAEPDLKVEGEADSGRKAIEMIQKGEWDLLVLDVSLPDLSGLEVLKEAKRISSKLPALILSMHPEEELAIRSLRAGAQGYLAKETAPEELIKAVRKILGGGQYISPATAERLADEVRRKDQGRPAHERLSDREFDVFRFIAQGKSVSEIAKQLCLSVKTVSTYRTRILEKMGLKTNADLIRYALTHRLIEAPPLSDKH